MRLLNVHTFRLHTFYGEDIPSYAILSHTWLKDYEEVTFAQLKPRPLWDWRELPGACKIDFLCQQAADDGYEWAWIDTCCIDKTNNAELSEAINSMFQWYQRSEVCYVYLMDVDLDEVNDIFVSRWWSRAWTLQELVAPTDVRFYDAQWRLTGSKVGLADDIARRKSIDIQTLRDSKTMYSRSIAQRMSWAAHRQATRDEDLAYALLGIFNINMTMQYGEGEKAFVRLQKEIMRTTNDMSIFAWGFNPLPVEDICSGNTELGFQSRSDLSKINCVDDPGNVATHGLYAARPGDFSGTQDIVHLAQHASNAGIEERYGAQILNTVMIFSAEWELDDKDKSPWHGWSLALLPCMLPYNPHLLVGILLRRWHHEPDRTKRYPFTRNVYSCLVRSDHVSMAQFKSLKIDTSETSQVLEMSDHYSSMSRTMIVVYNDISDLPFDVQQPTPWRKDESDFRRFIIRKDQLGFLTVLRFHRGDAPLAVYVMFPINPVVNYDPQVNTSNVVPCVIRAVPASTPEATVVAEMKDYGQLRARGPRVKCRNFCGHDRLYAKATTNTVFNQALTTVTLVKRTGLRWNKIDRIHLNEEQAVCLKREEWAGKQQ